ncbi:MAG: hypothetical protein ACRCUU_10915, partial [Plesiomonas sp.]
QTNIPSHGSLRLGGAAVNTYSSLKFNAGLLVFSTTRTTAKALTGGILTSIQVNNDYVFESASPIYFGNRAGGSDGYMFGHIRNFRIWHRALTDAQIKGLK